MNKEQPTQSKEDINHKLLELSEAHVSRVRKACKGLNVILNDCAAAGHRSGFYAGYKEAMSEYRPQFTASGAVWVRASERLSQVDVKKNLRINEAIPATGKLISKETKDYIIQYFGENVTAILPAEYVEWLDETHIPEKNFLSVLEENMDAAKRMDDNIIDEHFSQFFYTQEAIRKAIIETYEDLISIYKANYQTRIPENGSEENKVCTVDCGCVSPDQCKFGIYNKHQQAEQPQEQSKPVLSNENYLKVIVYDLVAGLSFGGFLSDRIKVEDAEKKIIDAFKSLLVQNLFKSPNETNPVSDEEIKGFIEKCRSEYPNTINHPEDGFEYEFTEVDLIKYFKAIRDKSALQTSAAGWSDEDIKAMAEKEYPSTMKIPKEIQDKIDKETKKFCNKESPLESINNKTSDKELTIIANLRMGIQIGFNAGATFGYNLAQEEITENYVPIKHYTNLCKLLEEKNKEIEKIRLDEFEKGVSFGYNQSQETVLKLNQLLGLKENERKKWADLCIKKQQEIKKLKEFIEETFWERHDRNSIQDAEAWQQFKTENNL